MVKAGVIVRLGVSIRIGAASFRISTRLGSGLVKGIYMVLYFYSAKCVPTCSLCVFVHVTSSQAASTLT